MRELEPKGEKPKEEKPRLIYKDKWIVVDPELLDIDDELNQRALEDEMGEHYNPWDDPEDLDANLFP